MLRAAYHLLRSSGRVLLEAAPEEMNVQEIGQAIATYPQVESVHDLHVWQISSGFPALSAHVLVGEGEDCHGIRGQLEAMLDERFEIEHAILQVDHAHDSDALVQIGRDTAVPSRALAHA
jgi:cobalt-zinc-cadmium efflux system protein